MVVNCYHDSDKKMSIKAPHLENKAPIWIFNFSGGGWGGVNALDPLFYGK